MKGWVMIEWVDSMGLTTLWEDRDDLSPLLPCLCRSTGFLLEDGPEYKTLAMTVTEEQVLGRLTIPSCAIRKVRQLK